MILGWSLPRRFQLPSVAPLFERHAFHAAFMGTVAACVGVSIVAVGVQRQRRLKRLRASHERRMTRWVQQYNQELREHSEAQLEVPEHERRSTFLEVDCGTVFEMWSKGKRLDCEKSVLDQLAAISAVAFNHELRANVLRTQKDSDLLVLRNLPVVLSWVNEMGLKDEIDPGVYEAACGAADELSRDNLYHLARVMLTSSRFRVVGICFTMAAALIGDRVCNEASTAFDHLTETVLTPSSETPTILVKWVVIHVFYSLLDAGVELARTRITHLLGQQFRRSIERRLCAALSCMDTEFFDAHTPTELNDLTYVGEELGEADTRLQSTVTRIITVVSRGRYLWVTSPRLGLLIAGVAGCAAAFQRMTDRVERWTTDFQEETAGDGEESMDAITQTAANMTLNSILQNVRTLRSFGREQALVQAWVDNKIKTEQSQETQSDANLFSCLFTCMSNLSVGYWRLLAMWSGTQAVVRTWVEAPLPLNVYQYTVQVFNLMQELQGLDFKWISECALRAHLLCKILDYKPKIETDGGFIPDPGTFRGDIEFKDVEFAYPIRPDRPVLRGLSLRAPSGHVLAVVGHSGCGKTTIMSLLLRFYDPDKGCIIIDGRDLREYNPKWLRKQIAHVSQEVQLFNMSIEDNIRIGLPSATFAEVVDACKRANAHGFIMKLPSGFKTHIGPNNFQLSGGQKQRIAIARALVMDAKILMLDEATSALDPESQLHVSKALKEVMRDRTTLFVTHRMGTTKTADSIAVVLHGRCVESGTHETLLAAQGPYEQLVNGEMPPGVEDSPVSSPRDVKWSFSSRGSVDYIPPMEEEAYNVNEIVQLEKALGRVQNPDWVDHSVFDGITHDLRVVLKWLQDLNHNFAAREIREALGPATHKLNALIDRVAGASGDQEAWAQPATEGLRMASPLLMYPTSTSLSRSRPAFVEEDGEGEEEGGFSYHAGA